MDIKNKKRIAGMIPVKEPVWAMQGKSVYGCKTQDQVLEAGGLNYQIAKDSLQCRGKTVDGHYAVVRTDTDDVFGIVRGRWKPIQNHDIFVFYDEFICSTGGEYRYAGSICNGEIPWIVSWSGVTANIIPGIMEIDFYSIAIIRHDGDHSTKVMFVPVHRYANSLLIAATHGENIMSISHSDDYETILELTKQLKEMQSEYIEGITTIFQKMLNKKVTENVSLNFFYNLVSGRNYTSHTNKTLTVRMENKINSIIDYYNNHETICDHKIHGSVLGLFCAVCGYYQNAKDYDSRKIEHNPIEKKFRNLFVSGDKDEIIKAFSMCNKMLKS